MTKDVTASAPSAMKNWCCMLSSLREHVHVAMKRRLCWTTLRVFVDGHLFVTCPRVFGRDSSSFGRMLWVRDSERKRAYSADYGGNVEVFDKVFKE